MDMNASWKTMSPALSWQPWRRVRRPSRRCRDHDLVTSHPRQRSTRTGPRNPRPLEAGQLGADLLPGLLPLGWGKAGQHLVQCAEGFACEADVVLGVRHA